MSVKIKICGLTRAADAEVAAELAIDAVGLVFYGPSPRNVDINSAIEVCAVLPAFTSIVGLFVDAEPGFVDRVLAQVPLDILQFHGNESEAYCKSFGRRYMKAIRMKPELQPVEAMQQYPSASAILLDAYQEGVVGGTGTCFDWQRVPKGTAQPIVLAGGLDASNIVEALNQTAVYGVDVSGGVELSRGLKSAQKMFDFVTAVRSVAN